MNVMLRQLRPALLAIVVFTVLLGVAYPLAVTGDRPARSGTTRPTAR